jgi:endogenous inhibitor of DNA gyrase (YacG/DUF329 family)
MDRETCVECGEEVVRSKTNRDLGYCINKKCKLYDEYIELDEKPEGK